MAAAGTALAVAPFLIAQGPGGTGWPFPGSALDLLPVYGGLLIAAGVAVAVSSLAAIAFGRADWALLPAPVAFVAGASLDVVHVSYKDEIVERSGSFLELRGPGPVTAAIACLVALLGSFALALLVRIGADRS